jgi:hypothetical protein
VEGREGGIVPGVRSDVIRGIEETYALIGVQLLHEDVCKLADILAAVAIKNSFTDRTTWTYALYSEAIKYLGILTE